METVAKVRDHIPLEQGLRPVLTKEVNKGIRQRPYSIRTRIKTDHLLVYLLEQKSETIFH